MENNQNEKPAYHQKVPGSYIVSTRLMFDLDLPFTPSVYDIIYVEKEYDPVINEYILKNYDEIRSWFAEKNLIFNYLPKTKEQPISNEMLQYMFPYWKPDHPFTKEDVSLELMKQHLLSGSIEQPALIHFIQMENEGEHEYYLFTMHTLDADGPFTLEEQIKSYSCNVTLNYRGENPMFSLPKPTGDDIADDGFHQTNNDLYRNMSDYDLEKEIRDRIKELREYREELLNIYKQITNRVIERNIEESIRDITDPTKNSINEKCARIREAFFKQFDFIYAKLYFIICKRGEPKKIILPRELVEYQTTI